MDYFKRLILQNFLSYEEGVFDFHPGVNMFIGDSDKGKSAVMDALFKLIYNRPMGNDFVSWWGKESRIYLETKMAGITYWKKKSKAGYILENLESGDIMPLTAGTGVPEDITRILNLSREVNIQRQLEKKAPIFLLSESPGDAARLLSDIGGLGSIDVTIKKAKEDITKNTREKKALETLITGKEKELLAYDGIDIFEERLAKAEALEREQDQLTQSNEQITAILGRMNGLREDIAEIDLKLKIGEEVGDIARKAAKMNKKAKIAEKIMESLTRIKEYRKDLQKADKALELSPLVKRGIQLCRISAQQEEEKMGITGSLDNINQLKKGIHRFGKMIKMRNTEYMTSFPDICPLCNQEIVREKL